MMKFYQTYNETFVKERSFTKLFVVTFLKVMKFYLMIVEEFV